MSSPPKTVRPELETGSAEAAAAETDPIRDPTAAETDPTLRVGAWPDAVAAIRAFVLAREWAPFHDPKNLAMGLASEAGELLAELRWIDNADADRACAEPERRLRIADEIADVLVMSLLLADRIGLDPPAEILRKLEKNALRYPVEHSRGKADPPRGA